MKTFLNKPVLPFLGIFLAVATLGHAQTPVPITTPFGQRAAPAQQASSAVNTNASTSSDYTSSTSENFADRLFNVNSDSVDFENGSFQWKGRTFNIGNARIMRARFERYLAAPIPEGDNQRYQQILNKIDSLLSPGNVTQTNFSSNLQEAWRLLFEAGKFEADGANCLAIATLVEKTAKQRQELRALQIARNEENATHKEQRRNATVVSRTVEERKDEIAKINSTLDPKKKAIPEPKRGAAEIQHVMEIQAETLAKIKRLDGSMTALDLRAKLEFQSQIVLFLFERRFQHALIANAFYRNLYRGGAQNLIVGTKQIKELFPLSDFTPSIDAVDMLAREAIKDVEKGMLTVADTYDKGYRHEAFQRLQETYFFGEHMMPVVTYDPERKRLMKDLWSSLRDMQHMGDERDLSGVEEMLAKVKTMAPDFPVVQVMSKVSGAMNASNLAVNSAQLAAFSGDMAKAETQLERAIKIWPTNPAVKKFTDRMRDRTDVLAQMVPEFDRLEKGGHLREIYNRKEEFGLALLQDKERLDKLKNIMGNLGQLDALLLQARTLSRNGNAYVAWDIIQTAEQFGANDPELGRAHKDLAAATADYAKLLHAAREDENTGNFSTGLTAFLAAQDLNPGSEHCRLGVQRLAEKLLTQMEGDK